MAAKLTTYYMDQKYIDELFVTVTKRNGTDRKTLWAEAQEFYQVVAQHTKCHIHVVRGYEVGPNAHEHAIIRVLGSEVSRFRKRYKTFKSKRAWADVHELSSFDQDKRVDAYRYVLVKHEPVLPTDSPEHYCGKYWHSCKTGECSHIPATVPAGTINKA